MGESIKSLWVMVFQRVQQINQRENEASSDPAPLNGEKQLWEYLLNFCISIEGLTKKKQKQKKKKKF